MTRPGVLVQQVDAAPAPSAPTATDTWFVAGLTTRGLVAPQEIVSLGDFTDTYGPRLTTSPLYDCMEAYFREGGARALVSRVVAASAVAASVSPAGVLQFTASSPGVWGNSLSVTVTTPVAGQTVVSISYAGAVVATSPQCPDYATLAAWASTQSWVVISLIGTWPPTASGPTPLVGGSDGTVVDADWQAALDRFTTALGPGQVSAPGRTSAAGLAQLANHADQHNRVALLDTPDGASVSTIAGLAAGVRALGHPARRSAMYAPWAVLPGLVPNTTRDVPWTAIQAGLFARSDRYQTPAKPASGYPDGVSNSALSLTTTFSDSDRDTLNSDGVNTARVVYNLIESYGARSCADPTIDAVWREIGHARVVMQITARAQAIAEQHIFNLLDGRGHEFARFQGELVGMLTPYFNDDSLYGDTPADAFKVDVGPSVNTPTTIANGELHATITLRLTHMAEYVEIDIVALDTTQVIP